MAIKPGFALIATLSLMILLAVIAVGLLSLSSITLRTSVQGSAQAEARANARMALLIAIGELQKNAGPDTRVTAPSGIVDESAAPLTGVWRSWEGSDHDYTGRPHPPAYGEKTRAESDGGRFLGWLVSGEASDPENPAALASGSPATDTVPLLSEGTLGEGAEGQVHVVPQARDDKSGSFAWWVSGENQKARLPKHYEPENKTAAGWSDLARSHAVADPKPFGLDHDLLVVSSSADKAITLATASFVAPNAATPPREYFHDLSVSSVGLLTNTATGGWRKDLSLVTENWDNLNDSGLPFFRLSPNGGDTTNVEKPTPTNPRAANSMIYPWSAYPGGSGSPAVYQHGAVSSWHGLKDFATAYQRIQADANGFSTPFTKARIVSSAPADAFDHLHNIKTMPIIARVHWVFSHRTIRNTNGTPDDTSDDTFNVQLLMSPVITMWNPYNVSISAPGDLRIALGRPLPCAFRHYDKDGNPQEYKRINRGRWPSMKNDGTDDSLPGNYPQMVGTDGINHILKGTHNYAPGETRVYSPGSAAGFSRNINMNPGYRPSTGHFVNNVAIGLKAEDPVKVDMKFDTRFMEGGFRAVGIYLDFYPPGNNDYMQFYRMFYHQPIANTYWPPIPATDLAQPEAVSIEGKWQPFMSVVYGSRVSGETTNLPPGKGVVQTNPLISYERSSQGAAGATGTRHPVNSSGDWSIFKHTGNDDKLPNASNDGKHRGYIISGFTAADGLSRMVLANLPLRPMASLAELQHWDLRSQNGFPPHTLNVIGNSDATPLIPSDSAVNPGGTGHSTNYQHDDSYCANHVLFDDWFFSSIAPEPENFGQAITTSQRERYKVFLMDHNKPLVNRSYRPIARDQNLTESLAGERADDMLDSHDGWQRVASRLEVEGMFNVNSTSVKAWRALLGHARNHRIPYHTEVGIAMSATTDHAVTRAPVAADLKAGEPGMSGGQFWSSEFAGYRVFDDDMLDTLTEKIVEQVRLRGPFLSLSEFVNRQLSDDEDLALAGAIQVALNEMAREVANKDPHKALKALSRLTESDPPGEEGYQFRKAAEGHSSYGLPGWIRQADVLTPLAPILSARDDTFTIRAYGDSRDKAGKIIAKAWCEATVRRTRDFVDPVDPADTVDTPSSDTNVLFGRRFAIRSFRWLLPDEV